MSGDEIEVMNTSVSQEEVSVSPENNQRREESDSHSDTWKVVARTQRAKYDKRYRERKKALKPPKSQAKTAAERCKAYRERLRFAAANAITPAPIPSKKGKIVSNSTSSVHLLSPNDGPAQVHNQHSMPKPNNIHHNSIRQQRNRNNAPEIDFDEILETPVQEAITTQPNYDEANNVNIDVHDDNELPNRESLGDLDFDMDIEEYVDGAPIEFDDDFVPPYSAYNEDDNQSNENGGMQRIRNVLTLEERVEVIRQYDIVPMYSKIARNFNCSWEQIKSVVSNRNAILEFHEATNLLSNQVNKDGELRRRKLNFLGHCLYEYIQRAQFYLNTDITEELIRNRAIEFRDLMRIEGFTPNKPWINHFKAAYNITLSNRQITITRRPPKSMDLKDIMTYCGRHTSMACNLLQRSPERTLPTTSDQRGIERPLYRTKTLVNTSCQNQATSDEVHMRRKRKITFLEKCLYEYIQRSQVHHKGRLDMDNLRSVAISLRDILKIDSFFPDKTWFNHFKSHYNFSFSVGVPVTHRRVPLSLDLRDIVSYCSRHEQKITLVHHKQMDEWKRITKAKETLEALTTSTEKPEPDDEDDDDCVAIETPTELIEIQDEDEDERKELVRTALKRKLANNSNPCSLKIEKIYHSAPSPQHCNDNDSVEAEVPEMAPAPSPGHYSEASDEAQFPSCVESYKDALRLLKPLEDFALMEENYRAIGLLTQLEKIFETGKKAAENGSSDK